jgi:hypothetical protein
MDDFLSDNIRDNKRQNSSACAGALVVAFRESYMGVKEIAYGEQERPLRCDYDPPVPHGARGRSVAFGLA